MHHLIETLSKRTHGDRLRDTEAAIALMAILQSEQRRPSQQEKETLAKFAGFGPIASVFEELRELTGQELRAHNTIKAALSDDWYRRGRRSIDSSYYTPPEVIPLLWDFALKALKPEKKIRVLEPGCGIGNFALYAPDIEKDMVGVELEPTSAAIAKLLGWGQVFNRDFVSTDRQRGFMCGDNQFDLAIGNVPFVDGMKDGWGKFRPKVELHARVFLRLLDLVKPGGFIVAITSTGTLDSWGAKGEYKAFRQFCDRRAIFHGAVRLPQGAFKGAYQTEVCSDIIVLQRRTPDNHMLLGEAWIDVEPCAIASDKTGNPTRLNEYFVAHPEQMLGVLALDKLTGDKAVVVGEEGQDTLALLKQALDRILQNVR